MTLGLSRDGQQALSYAAVGGRSLLGWGLECDSTVLRQGQQLPPPEVTKKGEMVDIGLRAPILHGRGKERCSPGHWHPSTRACVGPGPPEQGLPAWAQLASCEQLVLSCQLSHLGYLLCGEMAQGT